ncbi:FimV/HubP family polar landmark protein [Nitrosomonas sp. HPC101]|uniref:FimV/HubP family polar landmark protein n=1 Tax=Nitrosomonas sp. HPC101 TaxID=1658667 RepID=UPI0031F53055
MKIIDLRSKGVSLDVLSKTFLIVTLVSAWVVQAAGLGKLTVSSYLGQPLNAEIALESVANKEIDSLSARLASPEAFQKAGVNLVPYHATLSVSVEKRTDGRPYIRIRSPQAINEPFLNLLVELNSSSGHLLREYNVLLDPAEAQKTATTAPAVPLLGKDKTENPAMSVSVAPQLSAETEKELPAKLSVQAGGIYGPVIRGDTLSRIARQISSDSVNLNQMLVALYRANRDAFLERNMNLLKVGVILRIPDEGEVSSVTIKEAAREVAVQKEDWNNYRQRIAELATDTSEKSGLKQSQAGKITTIFEVPSIEGSGKPEEVLILSKGELLGDNRPSVERAEDRIAQNYLYMMEEDAIAKERALQEANERVAILEQNVAKLQRLLELKGSTSEGKAGIEPDHAQPIPSLQAISIPGNQQAGVAAVEGSTGALGPGVAIPENPTSPITIPTQPVKPISLPELLQPASSESDDEPAWMGTLLQLTDGNSIWIAAGLGALLATALGVSVIRRKKALSDDSDFSDIYDYTEKDDEPVPATLTEITSIDADSMKKLDEELIQRTAGTSESSDSGFTDTADNRTTDVDPGLFFGSKQDEKAIEPLFFTRSSVSRTDAKDSSIFGESNGLDHTTKPNHPGYQKETFTNDTEEAIERAERDTGEQWIFTADNDDLGKKSDEVQVQGDIEAHAFAHDEEHQIDFDLKLPEKTESSQEPRTTNELYGLSSSLANIDLDLGDKSGTESQAVHENPETDIDINMQWREVATKLDLARAYLEMDDHEGARDILEEVLREGDDEQQSAASSMLDEIG